MSRWGEPSVTLCGGKPGRVCGYCGGSLFGRMPCKRRTCPSYSRAWALDWREATAAPWSEEHHEHHRLACCNCALLFGRTCTALGLLPTSERLEEVALQLLRDARRVS